MAAVKTHQSFKRFVKQARDQGVQVLTGISYNEQRERERCLKDAANSITPVHVKHLIQCLSAVMNTGKSGLIYLDSFDKTNVYVQLNKGAIQGFQYAPCDHPLSVTINL